MQRYSGFLLAASILFGGSCLHAQKHDYVWITGDANDPSLTTHGGATIDFNVSPPHAYYNYRKLNMFLCNASICDSSGQLVAYTNGCDIAGADDEILEGGGDINPGFAHIISCSIVYNNDGYASGIQSAMFIPLPGHEDSLYYLFHKQVKLVSEPTDVFTEQLNLSVVDAKANAGSGKVILKNYPIIIDTLSYGKLSAVKHANGKDWWIITPVRKGNKFYILKFTQEGIVDTLVQSIGIVPDFSHEAAGQMVFSPDGTTLFRTNPVEPIMVYTFDRANGVFTGFDTISYQYGNQSPGEMGCAVSPNGRYLYLACRQYLYQLDLLAPDIAASQTTVAVWDGYAAPIPTLFWQCQLGPDCKIYIRSGDTRFYHVIHAPDAAGAACQVEQRGLPLPTPSGASMPSFPNYRLGPIDDPGLPCSPVVRAPELPRSPAPAPRLWPNPATDQLTAEWEAEAGDEAWVFELYAVTGRLAYRTTLPAATRRHRVHLENIPPGVYVYRLHSSGGASQGSGKIIVHP